MTDSAISAPGGWRASSLAHLPVVEVGAGQICGEVADLVFDPDAAALTGLLVALRGRHETLGESARRLLRGAIGPTYVDIGHVLSLNADMVTIELGQHPITQPAQPLPRLSTVLRFQVITLRGKRLGSLADLLLDAQGRRIVGYLVAPSGDAADRAVRSAVRLSAADVGDMPEMVRSEPDAAQATTGSAASAPLLVIPSDEGVRVGRDLIIVAGRAHGDQPVPRAESSAEAPFLMVRPSSAHNATDAEHGAPDTGWEIYDPDAPTAQMQR